MSSKRLIKRLFYYCQLKKNFKKPIIENFLKLKNNNSFHNFQQKNTLLYHLKKDF